VQCDHNRRHAFRVAGAILISSSDFPILTDFHMMRVFLIQNVKGLWPSSGEWRANINLLKYLASQGHTIAQMCYAPRQEIELYFAQAESKSRVINAQNSALRLNQGNKTLQIPVAMFTSLEGIYTIALDQESFQKHYPSTDLDLDVREYIEVSLQNPCISHTVLTDSMTDRYTQSQTS
jgi:hypothetical protein